jgi:hypothetical protein
VRRRAFEVNMAQIKDPKHQIAQLEEKPRYCLLKSAVVLLEAKSNPLFTEEQRALVRFLRYYESGKPVKMPCAHCGKKKSVLWTQLCSFKVADFSKPAGMLLDPGPNAKVFPPLTGVCQTHLMVPEVEEVDVHGNRIEVPVTA